MRMDIDRDGGGAMRPSRWRSSSVALDCRRTIETNDLESLRMRLYAIRYGEGAR